MRKYRLVSAFVAFFAAAAAILGIAPTASAASINYVALGDSYSSGVGASSSYLDSTCMRSASAYPYLYYKAVSPSSFNFVACSGATTADVTSSQLSALSSSTTLVSITIGGNDIGFADVMTSCVLYSTSTCTSAVNTAEGKLSTLSGSLNTLYTRIRTASPSARVVVLGYPVFYDMANDSSCIGLNTTKRTKLNEAAGQLNSTISAKVAGFSNFTFKSVVSAFSGHQLCDSTEWLHSLTWPISSSYHPTGAGQSGAYYPQFTAGI